jgi:hypothetical protein
MLFVGIVFLSLAGLLHCFYAANAKMRFGTAAGAFIRWRSGIVVFSIFVLLIALGFIWVGSSIFAVLASIFVYFFIFPLIFVPLLQLVYRPAQSREMSHFDMEKRDAQWAKVAGLDEPRKDCPSPNDFWLQLHLLLTEASDTHQPFVDIEAGELHRSVGWYPGPKHRMPICCRVMREEMRDGDIILDEPPKGTGASLVIRYRLPRLAA